MTFFQPISRERCATLPLIATELTQKQQEIESEVIRLESRMKTEAFVLSFFMLAALAGGIYFLATSGGPTNAFVFYTGIGSLALFCVLLVSLGIVIKKEKEAMAEAREEEQIFRNELVVDMPLLFRALASSEWDFYIRYVLGGLEREQFNLVARYAFNTVFRREEPSFPEPEQRLLGIILTFGNLNKFTQDEFNQADCSRLHQLVRIGELRNTLFIISLVNSLDNNAFSQLAASIVNAISHDTYQFLEDEYQLISSIADDARFANLTIPQQRTILEHCTQNKANLVIKRLSAEKFGEHVNALYEHKEICQKYPTILEALLANDLILGKVKELIFFINYLPENHNAIKNVIARFKENCYKTFAEAAINAVKEYHADEKVLKALALSPYVSLLPHDQKVILMGYKCSLEHLNNEFIEQTFTQMSKEEKISFLQIVSTLTSIRKNRIRNACLPIVLTEDFLNLYETGKAENSDYELLKILVKLDPMELGFYCGKNPNKSKTIETLSNYLDNTEKRYFKTSIINSANETSNTEGWIDALYFYLCSNTEIPLIMRQIFAGLPIPLAKYAEQYSKELEPILAAQTRYHKVNYYIVLHETKKDYFLKLANQELKEMSLALHTDKPLEIFEKSPIVNYLDRAPKTFLRQHVIENNEIHENLEFRYLFTLEILTFTPNEKMIKALDEDKNQLSHFTALLRLLMEEAHKCDPKSLSKQRKYLMQLFYQAPQYNIVNKLIFDPQQVEAFEEIAISVYSK